MENRSNFNEAKIGRQLPELEGLREKIMEKGQDLQKEAPAEREKIIKQEIEEKLKEFQGQTMASVPLSDRDEADEISGFSKEDQVQALVSLTFEKGLKKAINVAKKINNPALIDSFHDTLIDRYYEMLVSQGVIKM